MMAEKRVTVVPAEDFTGYPFGKKMQFRAGIESEPVPPDYAQLLADKGHLRKDAITAEKAK